MNYRRFKINQHEPSYNKQVKVTFVDDFDPYDSIMFISGVSELQLVPYVMIYGAYCFPMLNVGGCICVSQINEMSLVDNFTLKSFSKTLTANLSNVVKKVLTQLYPEFDEENVTRDMIETLFDKIHGVNRYFISDSFLCTIKQRQELFEIFNNDNIFTMTGKEFMKLYNTYNQHPEYFHNPTVIRMQNDQIISLCGTQHNTDIIDVPEVEHWVNIGLTVYNKDLLNTRASQWIKSQMNHFGWVETKHHIVEPVTHKKFETIMTFFRKIKNQSKDISLTIPNDIMVSSPDISDMLKTSHLGSIEGTINTGKTEMALNICAINAKKCIMITKDVLMRYKMSYNQRVFHISEVFDLSFCVPKQCSHIFIDDAGFITLDEWYKLVFKFNEMGTIPIQIILLHRHQVNNTLYPDSNVAYMILREIELSSSARQMIKFDTQIGIVRYRMGDTCVQDLKKWPDFKLSMLESNGQGLRFSRWKIQSDIQYKILNQVQNEFSSRKINNNFVVYVNSGNAVIASRFNTMMEKGINRNFYKDGVKNHPFMRGVQISSTNQVTAFKRKRVSISDKDDKDEYEGLFPGVMYRIKDSKTCKKTRRGIGKRSIGVLLIGDEKKNISLSNDEIRNIKYKFAVPHTQITKQIHDISIIIGRDLLYDIDFMSKVCMNTKRFIILVDYIDDEVFNLGTDV